MAEQVITLNLRRGFIHVPTWRKSKRAAVEIKEQIMHYCKVNDVKVSKWVNEAIWAHGAKSPPPKIKLKLDIDKEKKIAKVELAELPAAAKRLAEKQKKAEAEAKKKEDVKKAKEVKEEKKETKTEEKLEDKKEETKEEKKEQAVMTKQQELAMK